jgi:hypothetical protein
METENKVEEKIEEKKVEEKPKKKFNFKDYYKNNAEFRAKHLAKMKVQIFCPECNALICKYNLAKHRRTNVHKKRIELLKK